MSKRHRYFLVDYENVGYAGLDGIESLDKGDIVIIFYSKASSSISELAKGLLSKTKSEIVYEKVDTLGKNALDFQLSSYVGYIVSLGDAISTYIISKDFGYSNVQVFWYKKGKNIHLIPNIKSIGNKSVDDNDILMSLKDLTMSDDEKASIVKLLHQYLVDDRYPNAISVSIMIKSHLEYKYSRNKAMRIYNAIEKLVFAES